MQDTLLNNTAIMISVLENPTKNGWYCYSSGIFDATIWKTHTVQSDNGKCQNKAFNNIISDIIYFKLL